ncbi:hypothetical protein [Salmonella phage SSBI34]|nr:hypothetical protein [Salmonella phage SSBI34]
MAKPHLEVFASEFHMLQFFGKYLPKLDVHTSGRLAPFLYVYDNKQVLARNFFEFLTHMEELTALNIDTRASVQKNRAFMVFFNEQLKDPAKFVANVSAKVRAAEVTGEEVQKHEPIVSSEVVETVTETKEEVKESSKDKEEILAKAESLRDDSKKAAAKAALEAFAMEHGVSLSKAKTFDAMLEDLKAAL